MIKLAFSGRNPNKLVVGENWAVGGWPSSPSEGDFN